MRGCRRLPPPRRPRGPGLRLTLTLPPSLYRELRALAAERREALATTARLVLAWYLAGDGCAHSHETAPEGGEELSDSIP